MPKIVVQCQAKTISQQADEYVSNDRIHAIN